MERLIKTILGTSDQELRNILDLIDAKNELLSQAEAKYITYLKTTFDASKKFPSETMFLDEFPEMSVPLSNAKHLDRKDVPVHASLILQKRTNQNISRQLMTLANEIAKDGFKGSTYDKLRIIFQDAAITDDQNTYQNAVSIGYDLYKKKQQLSVGPQTFVKVIDDVIGGMHAGSFNVIFGYTGSFKTTWATNILYRNCYHLGYNGAYMSLEVVKDDLLWNILSTHSFDIKFDRYPFIPHDKIRKTELTDDEEDFIFNEVLPDLQQSQGKFYLLDETDFTDYNFLTIENKLREIDELCEEETGNPLDFLIIDQAQLLKFGTGTIGNENAVINAYVSFFRQQCLNFLGKKRPITVIMLSQANREGWKRAVKNGGKYDLRAISEANELERASWRIMSVYTDENLKESKEAKVQLLKNRTGAVIVEPQTVFVDPVMNVFGDEVDGFDTMLGADDFDQVFGGDDFSSLI